MTARFLRSLASAAALAALALPASPFGIGLQPTTVEISVTPGESSRQVINIANVHTEKAISLTLGLADWELDETGQIVLTPPGESVSSAAGWARFSPAFLTLKPGESEQVIVDMVTPTRLARSGDFRFALLASTVLPEQRAGQSGIWKKYQIATLFYLTVGPASSDPAILGGEIRTRAEDGARMLHVSIGNAGNAHARLQGSVEMTHGGRTETLDVGNLVVLHNARRDYVTPLPVDLPADARIEVKLENIFTPQTDGRSLALPSYRLPAGQNRDGTVTGDGR